MHTAQPNTPLKARPGAFTATFPSGGVIPAPKAPQSASKRLQRAFKPISQILTARY